MLLAGAAAVLSYVVYPSTAPAPAGALNVAGLVTAPDLAVLLGHGKLSSYAPLPAPVAIVTATASGRAAKARATTKAKATPKPTPSPSLTPSPTASPSLTTVPATSPTLNPADTGSPTPLAGGNYAGSLILNDTGSQLTSWNQTSSYCPATPGFVADGAVGTDSSGDVTLTPTSTAGSCAALISPGAYASDVIEADIYFPALAGKPGTIANWTGIWLTDGAAWPQDGELDATESEPVSGVDAASWHSGTAASEFTASTDDDSLPIDSANLTPGWHTVDIVYTKGFFEVYYDGHEYTSYTSGNVTGDPLNVYFTTVVTPATSSIDSRIGGTPVNSDTSSPAFEVKNLRIWSFQ